MPLIQATWSIKSAAFDIFRIVCAREGAVMQGGRVLSVLVSQNKVGNKNKKHPHKTHTHTHTHYKRRSTTTTLKATGHCTGPLQILVRPQHME